MQINSDISQRVVIEQSTLPWVATALPGVQIRTLEGGPAATRTTSIVKLTPGTQIGSCSRDLGEEIVVLDGVLTDQFGSYGKGCYVKIPPDSAHACESATGLHAVRQTASSRRE